MEVFADVKGIVVELARSVATDKQRLLPLGESAKSFCTVRSHSHRALPLRRKTWMQQIGRASSPYPPRAGCHIEPVKPLLIEPPLCQTLPFDVLVHRPLSNEGNFQNQMITSSKMYKREPLPHASSDTNGQCSKKVHWTAGLMYRRSEGGVPI